MMATTHALWGMALALPVLATAPEFAPVAFVAGFLGGLAPDLDLYTGHRKTLHYPIYGPIVVVPAVAVALLAPSAATVGLAVGLAAAALHAATDAAGGGLELRPWEAGSERAVYSHYHGRWLRPRRWVRYDGALEDLGLAGLAGGVLVAAGADPAAALAVALVAVSAVYTLFRKPLAALAEHLAGLAPSPVVPYLPERYREA
ncbi:metal-dependent hydrolase [Saliphagus infecundisoli]|uniref:Metal-dependent hydrolase n=1 Tax=Saliphagus infecundisoli TaxID=1849069 RepID=A0ABD5QLA3_9EURY|nr:metal-dependent hydrolase [Saliphagus infecundisoli]